MNVEALRDPKEFTIDGKTFYLHHFPARMGRKIAILYVEGNIPKLGSYEMSESIMLDLMKYVTVKLENGVEIALDLPDLIDNHVTNAEMLLELERAMMEYNFSFFGHGEISALAEKVWKVAEGAIVRILTRSLGQSSPADGQRLKN